MSEYFKADSRLLSFIASRGPFLAPLLLWTFFDKYHAGDVSSFVSWAHQWDGNLRHIYWTGTNYPAVGFLTAVLPFSTAKLFPVVISTGGAIQLFRLFLTLIDLGNIILFRRVARLLEIKYPSMLAFLFYLLPSTWAGGVVWGQIDNIVLFCSLATVASFLCQEQNPGGRIAWALGVFCFILTLYTKQLSIFIAPALVLMCIKMAPKDKKFVMSILLCSILLISLLEYVPIVPQKFASTSTYLWLGGGSSHSSVISANGFNVWTLFAEKTRNASSFPVLGNLTSNFLGRVGFVTLVLFVTIGSVLNWRTRSPVADLLTIVVFQIGFNLLMPGTHERYLYLCYPYFLLAVAYLFQQRQANLAQFAVVAISAAIYGTYVLSVLGPGLLGFRINSSTMLLVSVISLVQGLYLWVSLYSSKRARKCLCDTQKNTCVVSNSLEWIQTNSPGVSRQ